MTAQILHIDARTRPFELAPAGAADFVVHEGEQVDAGIVLTDPTLSLYCLDPASRRALFVETPATLDLSQVPFMYVAQHTHATRLLAVPYAELHALAAQIDVRDEQITFIHSTGRCGSTLVSAAFNAADDVVSLSEPDVFFAVNRLRAQGEVDDGTLVPLLRSATKLLCKPTPQVPAPRAWVIKFRAQELMLGDLFHAAFPRAAAIYLYRNADTWLRSIQRTFSRDMEAADRQELTPEVSKLLESMAPLLPAYMADPATPKTPVAVAMLLWLSSIDRYLELHAAGMPMLAARYEQLQTDPQAVMQRLFAHAGVTLSDPAALDAVLARDSQAGSAIAQAHQRDVEPDAAMLADMRAVIEWHPVIDRVDFVVPGTLAL